MLREARPVAPSTLRAGMRMARSQAPCSRPVRFPRMWRAALYFQMVRSPQRCRAAPSSRHRETRTTPTQEAQHYQQEDWRELRLQEVRDCQQENYRTFVASPLRNLLRLSVVFPAPSADCRRLPVRYSLTRPVAAPAGSDLPVVSLPPVARRNSNKMWHRWDWLPCTSDTRWPVSSSRGQTSCRSDCRTEHQQASRLHSRYKTCLASSRCLPVNILATPVQREVFQKPVLKCSVLLSTKM